jgi:predicted ATP-dependent protease
MDRAVVEEIRRLTQESDGDRSLRLLSSLHPKSRAERREWEFLAASVSFVRCDFESARGHAIRALRLGSRDVFFRAQARLHLANAMIRCGEVETAERQLIRGLAEVEKQTGTAEVRARFVNDLGRIHRRRGAIGLAIAAYQWSLSLAPIEDRHAGHAFGRATNLAAALLHHDEVERAATLIEELRAAGAGAPEVTTASSFHLIRYLIELRRGRLDACEAALREAPKCAGYWHVRNQRYHRVYTAELQAARGHHEIALPALRDLLAEVQAAEPNDDMVCTVARVLASSLLERGDLEEALAMSRLASSSGRRTDALEWVRGLRLEAQCLAALGRHHAARLALAYARAALEVTDFPHERELLQKVALRSSSLPGPNGRGPSRWQSPPSMPIRASVPGLRVNADGRTYFTRDEALVGQIRLAAASTLPVLIEGETGTGKELIAHLLHELGSLVARPFVVVDCAALPESLAEAELFGARRGAYTGAVADRTGLFEAADGGTLFLDEMAEMPLPLQAKLLRVLQEGTYRRVGDVTQRRTRVRIVAASNRNLVDQVRRGALKQDLYYRIKGHRIVLAPLRLQVDEIGWLAEQFARREGFAGVTPDAVARLRDYDWPGNVRQLEMCVRLASTHCAPGGWLDARQLDSILEDSPRPTPARSTNGLALRSARSDLDREIFSRALQEKQGNVSAAARALGISRQGLYKALRRTGLA